MKYQEKARYLVKSYKKLRKGDWGNLKQGNRRFSSVKTVDSEILPDLQANRLIYDSLMNTDRRYKTPQSETKNGLSLPVITVVRVQHFPLFPQAQIPQGNVKKTK